MRITAINRGDRSSRGSDTSTSSSGTLNEYDIWRRWEDCLWIQDIIEKEYARAARERRTKLAQGKGVKMFNGMYKQDMASSWESLPPGPEPDSVAREVHTYIPHLTKKGTFFRPKPALVEKRQLELQALVEALMSDDMPALVKEIRATRIVTDFFGFWRRDVEIEEKRRKKIPCPRSSISSSVFSAYFTASPTLQGSQSSRSIFSGSTVGSSLTSPSRSTLPDNFSETSNSRPVSQSTQSSKLSLSRKFNQYRHRTNSSGSSSSEELPSDSSYTANSSAPRIAAEETRPVKKFDHNPASDLSPVDESIAERAEVYLKTQAVLEGQRQIQLRRSPRSINDRRSNRNWSVYASPVGDSFEKPPASPVTVTRDDASIGRGSWQSTASGASANTFLEGLNLAIPLSPISGRDSIATFMTTNSADAVFPRNTSGPSTPMSDVFSDLSRASGALSLSDFGIIGIEEGDEDSAADDFPRPMSDFPRTFSYISEVDARPDTPTAERKVDDKPQLASPSPRKDGRQLPPILITLSSNSNAQAFVPASPTDTDCSTPCTVTSFDSISTDCSITSFDSASSYEGSAFTTPNASCATLSTITSPTVTSPLQRGGHLTIKASHNESTIMLKVPREIEYEDLCQRLFKKFVGQEGVPLPFDFTLIHPSKNDEDVGIESDWEWRDVADFFDGSKLILRIVGPS